MQPCALAWLSSVTLFSLSPLWAASPQPNTARPSQLHSCERQPTALLSQINCGLCHETLQLWLVNLTATKVKPTAQLDQLSNVGIFKLQGEPKPFGECGGTEISEHLHHHKVSQASVCWTDLLLLQRSLASPGRCSDVKCVVM